MLRSVWTKTLWEGRNGIVLWSVALAGVSLMYALFYPSINQESFAQAMESFPEALMLAFGWDDLTSAAGYLGSTVFGLLAPILLIVFAIGLGTRAIAGDEEAGTLDLLLAHPVSRARVVLERALALAVSLTVATLAVFGAIVAARGVAELDALSVSAIAAASLHLLLLALTFGTLALALGAIGGSRSLALSGAAIVAVLGYFGNTIARQVDATRWLATLSPFRYYEGGAPLRNGLQVGDATVLLVASALFFAVAVVALGRRDVGA
ncbi:ABC transporter permease [soil metagenome]